MSDGGKVDGVNIYMPECLSSPHTRSAYQSTYDGMKHKIADRRLSISLAPVERLQNRPLTNLQNSSKRPHNSLI